MCTCVCVCVWCIYKVLFLVPFCALCNENGEYLVEKCTISIAPSIQVRPLFFCLLLLIIFALCIDMQLHCPIQVFAQMLHRSRLQSGESQKGTALVVGNPPTKYPPLPAAKREASQIAKLHHVDPVLGEQGTLSYVTSKMPTSKLVHLATHGVFDLKRSENAYIPGAVVLGADGGKYVGMCAHLPVA